MDLGKYWAAVKRTAELMPPGAGVWLTSCDQIVATGGKEGVTTFVADRKSAAQRIVEKTHRLATSEEIAAAEEGDRRRDAECAATERMRNANTKLQLTPELLAAVTSQRRK